MGGIYMKQFNLLQILKNKFWILISVSILTVIFIQGTNCSNNSTASSASKNANSTNLVTPSVSSVGGTALSSDGKSDDPNSTTAQNGTPSCQTGLLNVNSNGCLTINSPANNLIVISAFGTYKVISSNVRIQTDKVIDLNVESNNISIYLSNQFSASFSADSFKIILSDGGSLIDDYLYKIAPTGVEVFSLTASGDLKSIAELSNNNILFSQNNLNDGLQLQVKGFNAQTLSANFCLGKYLVNNSSTPSKISENNVCK